MKILQSVEDKSVNFVEEYEAGRISEFRFVQRNPDYFIVYLSTHMGCNKLCRFCHLTQTGQTDYTELTPKQILSGANRVMEHFDSLLAAGRAGSPNKVHFNFMSRGEPLGSSVWERSHLLSDLVTLAKTRGLAHVRINVSTIIPEHINGDLSSMFPENFPVTLYYSCYSEDEAFRSLWLPNARPLADGIKLLKTWQDKTNNDVVLHWGFIAGQNDTDWQVDRLLAAVAGLRISQINIVHYNPYSPEFGEEPGEPRLENLLERIKTAGFCARIVPRVGFDVKASCGMFVDSLHS